MSAAAPLRSTTQIAPVVAALGVVLSVLAACSGNATSSKVAAGGGHAGVGGLSASSGGAAGYGAMGGVIPPNDPANFACPLDQVCTANGQRPKAVPKPSCPDSAPAEGSACSAEGLTCSYGDSVTAYCRSYLTCSAGSWKTPDNRKDVCLSQPANFCPAKPSQGAACTVGSVDVFVSCEYSGGVACYCLGNPVGITGAKGAWECYGPPRNSACPELLPNIGDGCSSNGQTCHYGIVQQGCYAPYADVFCYQGAWEAAQSTCTL
ncbi:MAG: hypothetical protein ACOY0T_31865 [Myxococcota bacterium]